jgi:DNA-binding response OmpR family regulator
MYKNKILVVEDDIELAEWICTYLTSQGFETQTTSEGRAAIEIVRNAPPAFVLLDGMLPDIDGLDVCRSIRHFYSGPIVMLTARDEEIDEVLGLEVGADDYLTKPVRARALLARIRNHLRRCEPAPSTEAKPETRITLGTLCIDKSMRSVQLDNHFIKVSSHEFDLLWVLAKRAGEVVSREELISILRGFDYDGFDRSIDLRVSRLRRKLKDDPDNPNRIKTIWGKGYLLVRDNWL